MRTSRYLAAVSALGLLVWGGCPAKHTAPDPDSGPPADAGVDGGGPGCTRATGGGSGGTERWQDGPHTATIQASGSDCARTFTLSTTAPLRDNQPANPRTFAEPSGGPSVSTNNLLFDGLYALALAEVRENSVDAIQDFAYNGGAPIPCPAGGCFETGRLWTFVWTRDTAYAVDLALAALDPTRARNSLEFKLSERRGGGGRQIVQDTGSGGSYPVSSDRAVWALGAARLLGYLDGAERQAFVDLAWDAVRNTIAHDREVVYDPVRGLYTGEQSFLDWREQSYPRWTQGDVVQIAMSHALSTNVGHLQLLALGARLAAEKGDSARETVYRQWADALRGAIDATFYHDDLGLYGTFITGFLDPAPVRHFDLLGSSLAVLADVGDATRHAEVVRSYPHLGPGAPVIWPQQKEIPIYHNRGIWPFVSAYWLRAARRVRNDAVVDHTVRSLIRGAALNLSNMENFECVSGAPWVDDGIYSGPVVNSQRQLWSVAGYLSMVHDVIFGIEVDDAGLAVRPYVTRELRRTIFAGADRLVLNRFPYRGSELTIVVNLPAVGTFLGGAYAVGEVRLDGQAVNGVIDPARLGASTVIEVDLLDLPEAPETMTEISDTGDYRDLFGPLPPQITGVVDNAGQLEVRFQGGGEAAAEIAFNIYRDGVRVAQGLAGGTTTWPDPGATPTSPSHCYTVEAYFVGSGNHSQHAKPWCWWGPGAPRVQSFFASGFTAVGGTFVLNHGREHYENWGEPGHTIEITGVQPNHSGEHLVQAVYGNGAGDVSTGITCAVKRVTVRDESDDRVVASGFLVMPHLGAWDVWADSSFVRADLESAKTYRITLSHDATSINMSDFEHNALYGGSGGSGGAYHYVNISELKLLSRTNTP